MGVVENQSCIWPFTVNKNTVTNPAILEGREDYVIVTNSPFQHNSHCSFPSVFFSSFASGGSETAWANFKIVLLVPIGGIIL